MRGPDWRRMKIIQRGLRTFQRDIYGEPRLDGAWEGWLEFVPMDPALPLRRTDRETTQPDLPALEYWATGLEPLYLAGSFEPAL